MDILDRLFRQYKMFEDKEVGKAIERSHSRAPAKFVGAGVVLALIFLLTFVTSPPAGQAAFPGTNGKIAFTSSRDGDPDIFVMNADGSNQTPLTFNTATDGSPTWSPDGNKIAFDSNITGDFEIYVMDKDGSNLMNITQTPSSGEFQPAWSADGSEIAFITNRAGGLLDIYKINADATGPQTPLATTGFQEEEPAWAPDNSKIVYRRGDSTLFTMNSDGTGQAQLPLTPLPAGVIPRSPSDWSPDAQKIAFGGDRPGTGFQVFVSNADGTGVTELTAFPGNNYLPAFSPDGTKIAFTSDRDGNQEIYVMNANGSGQTNLTTNLASDYGPDWQPLPPDTTPPEIAPNVTCDDPGNPPWCKGNITVSWTVTDPESSITSTSGCETTTISSDTPLTGTTLTCTATSAGGTTSNSVTVYRDGSAPTVSLNSLADSCDIPGNAGWCRGTQTAGFSASDATSGVASPCSGASCNFTQSTTTNGSAVTIASGAVCDVAGNCNAGIDAGPYMIDSAGPSISIVSPANGGTYILNAAVASSYGCSDETSGVATCSGPVASGADFSTSPVGAHAFTVNATDVAGNQAQATNNYNVIYNFSGFSPPVDNLPTLNGVKAGSAVPVKFSLNGNQGLSIFEAGYPKSQTIPCDSTAPVDGIEETATAGSSGLSYDASVDQYVYVWKTEKAWAGTCRQLVVKLNDGTSHQANFNFTK